MELQLQQPLLDGSIIRVLFLGNLLQSTKHEFEAGNRQQQQVINQEHAISYPAVTRSSLRRMLTKLYGGQGPVYLNLRRFPYLRAILFTTSSNSASRLRSTRKAAFMIILSPIG